MCHQVFHRYTQCRHIESGHLKPCRQLKELCIINDKTLHHRGARYTGKDDPNLRPECPTGIIESDIDNPGLCRTCARLPHKPVMSTLVDWNYKSGTFHKVEDEPEFEAFNQHHEFGKTIKNTHRQYAKDGGQRETRRKECMVARRKGEWDVTTDEEGGREHQGRDVPNGMYWNGYCWEGVSDEDRMEE